MREPIENREWLNMTLKDFIKKNIVFPKDSTKEQRDEKTEEVIKELPADYQRVAEKNAEQMDKHMVWVAGGATVLIVTIFTSDRFPTLCYTAWLVPSLIGFGLCLLLVIASYRIEAQVLAKMPETKDAVNRLFRYMHSVKSEDDQDEAWRNAESMWKRMTRSIKWGLRFVTATQWVNSFAFVFFMIGMIAFVMFGTMSVLSSPSCMTQDEQKTSGQQSSGPVEKSSQVSSPMFQQLVSSIPSALTGSGTSPMLQPTQVTAPPSSQGQANSK